MIHTFHKLGGKIIPFKSRNWEKRLTTPELEKNKYTPNHVYFEIPKTTY